VVRTVDIVPTRRRGDAPSGSPRGDGRGPRGARERRRRCRPHRVRARLTSPRPRTPERQAVRTATHKLIRDVSDGAIEIYDHTTDPKENAEPRLAAPRAAALTEALDGFRAELDGTGYQLRLRGRARPRRSATRSTLRPIHRHR
jgi:hypothetical protein